MTMDKLEVRVVSVKATLMACAILWAFLVSRNCFHKDFFDLPLCSAWAFIKPASQVSRHLVTFLSQVKVLFALTRWDSTVSGDSQILLRSCCRPAFFTRAANTEVPIRPLAIFFWIPLQYRILLIA